MADVKHIIGLVLLVLGFTAVLLPDEVFNRKGGTRRKKTIKNRKC